MLGLTLDCGTVISGERKFFLFDFLLSGRVYTCHNICVEVGERLRVISPVLPVCGSQGRNSVLRVCGRHLSSPTESFISLSPKRQDQ